MSYWNEIENNECNHSHSCYDGKCVSEKELVNAKDDIIATTKEYADNYTVEQAKTFAEGLQTAYEQTMNDRATAFEGGINSRVTTAEGVADTANTNAINAVASANTASTVAAEAKEIADINNARLDTAISGITQDNEVMDIRVGADGKTYATAGEAVRGQIKDINDSINGKTFEIDFIENEYVKNNGSFADYDGWARSDYLDCHNLDKIIYTAAANSTYNAFYDENKNFISAFSVRTYETEKNTNGAYYFAISGETETVTQFNWQNKPYTPGVKDNINNVKINDPFYGKKWVACGDSFTEGNFNRSLTNDYIFTVGKYKGYYKVYPYYVGNRHTGLTVINEAISGSTMTGGDSGINGFSESRYLAVPSDTDYITLRFGINDSGHDCPMGTIDDTTNDTFYGAWNVVLDYFTTNFPYAHIGIIVGEGMQTAQGKLYAQAEIEIAKKWGIPYLNIQFESGGGDIPLTFRTSNPDVSEDAKQKKFNAFAVNPNPDSANYHPNEKAHEYESYFIEEWLKTI